jgi:hypothetical protein
LLAVDVGDDVAVVVIVDSDVALRGMVRSGSLAAGLLDQALSESLRLLPRQLR